MNERKVGGFKRALALMMSIFIILSQLALPVAALAQDLFALPTLSLSYPVGEGVQSVVVTPSLYAQQPVYWATVPAEALMSGVTLDIQGVEGESYNSTAGYQLMAQDATEVDGMAASYIEVYRNGSLAGSYPLYLSTQPLPPEQPTYFDPVPVQVNCYDQDGGLITSYGDSVGMDGKTFTAPELDGYVLTGESSVTVTMDENGWLSQDVISFYYQKQLQPANVRVEAYDQNGNLIYSGEETIQPENGREIYAPELDGYVLSGESAVWVEMYADGRLSHDVVVFQYTLVPKTASITVKVVDSQNPDNVFYSETDNYAEGLHPFVPNASYLPENYVLDNPDGITVTVYADGTADLYRLSSPQPMLRLNLSRPPSRSSWWIARIPTTFSIRIRRTTPRAFIPLCQMRPICLKTMCWTIRTA